VDAEKGYNVNRKNVHWGGIIGHAGGMLDVVPTAEVPYPFLIENCYNLHNEQRNAYEQNTDRYYVGGLIGRSYARNQSGSVLHFRNCYSVKVDGAGGPTLKGDGKTVYATYTNEFWYETQASSLSSEGKTVIQVLDNSVGTRTVEEMYWASEGCLWEYIQRGEMDIDAMEKDFRSLLEFWKTIYLRENREKMKDDREDF
jgi:hypothetical protein